MNKLMDQIRDKARSSIQNIVLPEATDERVIKAADIIRKEGLARPLLLGNPEEIATIAAQAGINIKGLDVIDFRRHPKREQYALSLSRIRGHKGVTEEIALELLQSPLYYATMMIKEGDAQGMVAGSLSTTGDVLRPALQIIKTAPGISVVSGAFIMIVPDQRFGERGVMIFADCAVNPDPTAEELAQIAYSSAMTAKNLAGIEPKVGMLSFSTKGSAAHEFVSKVQMATDIAKAKYPHLSIDGELQADAALVPSVGAQKAPGSEVAGKVNVLVFPDLQSGNIGYKLGQRLANAEAIGPVLQGMAAPVNDLSRGCSAEDIVNVVAITAVQAQSVSEEKAWMQDINVVLKGKEQSELQPGQHS